jgi:hypothetical protein
MTDRGSGLCVRACVHVRACVCVCVCVYSITAGLFSSVFFARTAPRRNVTGRRWNAQLLIRFRHLIRRQNVSLQLCPPNRGRGITPQICNISFSYCCCAARACSCGHVTRVFSTLSCPLHHLARRVLLRRRNQHVTSTAVAEVLVLCDCCTRLSTATDLRQLAEKYFYHPPSPAGRIHLPYIYTCVCVCVCVCVCMCICLPSAPRRSYRPTMSLGVRLLDCCCTPGRDARVIVHECMTCEKLYIQRWRRKNRVARPKTRAYVSINMTVLYACYPSFPVMFFFQIFRVDCVGVNRL